jgi:multidrug efflux system outer membrane protein
LAVYERTVLRALEETENAIVRYTREIVRRARLQIAANASQRAARLARVRYRGGVDSFINVLDAERRQLEAQTQLAISETETARSLIALYKALGGGWQYAFGP